jgi:hypothetical protein
MNPFIFQQFSISCSEGIRFKVIVCHDDYIVSA